MSFYCTKRGVYAAIVQANGIPVLDGIKRKLTDGTETEYDLAQTLELGEQVGNEGLFAGYGQAGIVELYEYRAAKLSEIVLTFDPGSWTINNRFSFAENREIATDLQFISKAFNVSNWNWDRSVSQNEGTTTYETIRLDRKTRIMYRLNYTEWPTYKLGFEVIIENASYSEIVQVAGKNYEIKESGELVENAHTDTETGSVTVQLNTSKNITTHRFKQLIFDGTAPSTPLTGSQHIYKIRIAT